MTEYNLLQKPAELLLRKLNIKYIHIGNRTLRTRYTTNSKIKGVPDLIIPCQKSITLYIEFKLTGEKLRKEQIEWQNYLLDNSHKYYIISDLNDFIDLINKIIK